MKKNYPLLFAALISTLFVLAFPFFKQAVNAQAGCPVNNSATGLISAPEIVGFGNNIGAGGTGVCNQSTSAAFLSREIPNYDDFKKKYYTLSKVPSSHKVEITAAALPVIQDQYVYHTSGNIDISSPVTGSGTAVVFIDGYLNITADINYGNNDASRGLVFVVKGKVYIDRNVTLINAIIISEDTIYTAASYSDSQCTRNGVSTNQLVINGSIISNSSSLTGASPKPPVFCRTLTTGNTQPAELINHQVKYLVLLRNLLSDTVDRWTEIQ